MSLIWKKNFIWIWKYPTPPSGVEILHTGSLMAYPAFCCGIVWVQQSIARDPTSTMNKWPTSIQLQDINDSINLDEIDESSTSAAVKMTQVMFHWYDIHLYVTCWLVQKRFNGVLNWGCQQKKHWSIFLESFVLNYLHSKWWWWYDNLEKYTYHLNLKVHM